MEKWDKCSFAVDPEDLKGRQCYGGLDLSSTTDITAFVLVFPPEYEDDKYIILPFFWIPEDNLDLRVRRDHVPYDIWEKQGFLQTTEGNVVHYGFIESFIEELMAEYQVPGVMLSVVRENAVIFQEVFGVSDIEIETKADKDTLFYIASATKAFTALSIALLVEDGLLEWDKPICKYIGSFQTADDYITKNATIRDLLSHRTGIAESLDRHACSL
jgi:hypothetical protein